MKIKEITMQNYKRFVEPKTISFCDDEGEINDMTLLVGDNGSGKSSVLQAIAMVVGSAVRPHTKPETLDYPGFVYKHIQTGNMPVKVEVTLEFSDAEIDATFDYATRLRSKGDTYSTIKIPSRDKTIVLRLDKRDSKVKGNTPKAFFQTKGYQNAAMLKKYEDNPRTLFDNVGSIYWYSEQRTAYSLNHIDQPTNNLEMLRELLVKLNTFNITLKNNGNQLRPNQENFYETLEANYRKVFPTRRFIGSAPDFDNPYAPAEFWLSDGINQYELAGMSAGERAIFPLLVDFSLNNINNSIILIDELELHLHPPLQQALLDALPELGNNNQFIIATHSDYITTMFKPSQIIRLNH